MTHRNARWTVAPGQPALREFLARELQLSPLLAQCLLNRGLSEPEPIRRFLEPRLKQLADPFLLPGMDAAVKRLHEARERDEPLVVFGDYDVDGISATALLAEVLGALGWRAARYLPHRLDEGYGLTRSGMANCLDQHPVRLVLAVDCGTNAVDTIAWLQARGVDTVVVDHHQVSQPRPDAVAVVNPQCAGPGEPCFRELCSAGLAFKLAHALVKRGREQGGVAEHAFDVRGLLDLAALGTIADLVPLTGENRILVQAGLDRLNRTTRPGLIALKSVAQVKSPVGGYEVGFQLAPRLNAAGRLDHAMESLELLQANDTASAEPVARRLDAHNRQRQEIERTISQEVIRSVRERFDPDRDWVLVEGNPAWHIGVVGIVASRVAQEFYRPALIFGADEDGWRGSGRSIEGFDLAAALGGCESLLLRHGGHAMAAGVSIDPANVDALRARLNEAAKRALQPGQLRRSIRLDDEVPLGELTVERVVELGRLQQTGMGNPQVQLCARGLAHQRPLQRMGSERQHVKMWVTDGDTTLEAVWWGAGAGELPVGRFDLAFAPRINEYNGKVAVQLNVLDWRPESPGQSPL